MFGERDRALCPCSYNAFHFCHAVPSETIGVVTGGFDLLIYKLYIQAPIFNTCDRLDSKFGLSRARCLLCKAVATVEGIVSLCSSVGTHVPVHVGRLRSEMDHTILAIYVKESNVALSPPRRAVQSTPWRKRTQHAQHAAARVKARKRSCSLAINPCRRVDHPSSHRKGNETKARPAAAAGGSKVYPNDRSKVS